jgi:hypothetical protein
VSLCWVGGVVVVGHLRPLAGCGGGTVAGGSGPFHTGGTWFVGICVLIGRWVAGVIEG